MHSLAVHSLLFASHGAEVLSYAIVLICVGWPAFLVYTRLDRSAELKHNCNTAREGRSTGQSDPLETMLAGWRSLLLYGLRSRAMSVMPAVGMPRLVEGMILPAMAKAPDLLGVPIRYWGSDWDAGPSAVVLDQLLLTAFAGHAGAAEKLRRCAAARNWKLAGEMPGLGAHELAVMLDERLSTIVVDLHLRPVVIAHDFDWYREQHTSRFADATGASLSADGLRKNNEFWGVIGKWVERGQIHLLVITRPGNKGAADCVAFSR